MLSRVAYQSRTTDFWQACDAIAGPAYCQQYGAPNDGKGEPDADQRASATAAARRDSARSTSFRPTEDHHADQRTMPGTREKGASRSPAFRSAASTLSNTESALHPLRAEWRHHQRLRGRPVDVDFRTKDRQDAAARASMSSTTRPFAKRSSRRATRAAHRPPTRRASPPLGPQKYRAAGEFRVESTATRAQSACWCRMCAAIIDAAKAKGLVAAGYFERSAGHFAIANKAGNFGFGRYTDCVSFHHGAQSRRHQLRMGFATRRAHRRHLRRGHRPDGGGEVPEVEEPRASWIPASIPWCWSRPRWAIFCR